MKEPITRIDFVPAPLRDESLNTSIRKLFAAWADTTDKFLMYAIIQEARENGITELYVLNKDFILSAIREKMKREAEKEE